MPAVSADLMRIIQHSLDAHNSEHIISVSARKFYLRAKVAPEDLF